MKKAIICFMLIMTIAPAIANNNDYHKYLKNLVTCTPYKYTTFSMVQIDQEILGWEDNSCLLRDITYTYNLPQGTNPFSLSKEELKSYIVPDNAAIYSLTKGELAKYYKSLISGKNKIQNANSITISTEGK